MAILSTFIDRLQGATLSGVTLRTFPHSLPATNPELVALQMRSVVSATAHGALYAVGGNASLLTVGLEAASVAAGSNLAFFDAYSFVFWTPIR